MTTDKQRIAKQASKEFPEWFKTIENFPAEDIGAFHHEEIFKWIGKFAAHFSAHSEQGWVSVSERFPDDWDKVDVWFDVWASPSSFGMSDRWREPNCYRKDGKWFHLFKGEEAELKSQYITHWRPLPAPPVHPESAQEVTNG